MKKVTLYFILSIWLAGLGFSLSKDSPIIDIVFSVISIGLGTVVFGVGPRTSQSKQVGYKTIGIVLVIGGIFTGCIAVYEKTVLLR